MKVKENIIKNDLIDNIEHVSSEIQLLALNIAVAAAKIAHKENLGPEVNQRLSEIVNEATLTVRRMNQILNAAGSESAAKRVAADMDAAAVDRRLIDSIENSMEAIISDSEKIARLLSEFRKR